MLQPFSRVFWIREERKVFCRWNYYLPSVGPNLHEPELIFVFISSKNEAIRVTAKHLKVSMYQFQSCALINPFTSPLQKGERALSLSPARLVVSL